MSIEQLALVAAAALVVLWPQIQAQLTNLRLGAASRTTPLPRGGRAEWVATVLALQDELTATGRDKAALLAGQLVVEIVSGHTPDAEAKK
jgi:hypothetical protein